MVVGLWFKMRFVFLKKYWWWLLLLLIAFWGHSNHTMNSDEGVLLSGAWNIVSGRHIYNDFFAIVTPGTYYVLAGWWQLLGISYWSAKGLSILLVFFTALGLYRLSRFLPGKFYFLAPVFFVASSLAWPIISYHIYNLFFLVWATFYFIRALEKNSLKNLIISGLLSAAAILFLQSKGLILVISLLIYLAVLAGVNKNKLYWRWFWCYGLFSLAPNLFLLLFWSPQTLYQYLVAFPFFHYSAIIKTPFYLWYFFLVLLAGAILACYRQADKKIWLFFGLQLALLLAAKSLPDWFHISIAIFPLFALWPFFMARIWLGPKPERFFYSVGLLSIAIFMALPSLLQIGQMPFRTVSGHPLFQEIKNYCSDSPYIYAGSFIPGVYFETRKLNATPFDWLITNHHTAEQFLAARADIIKNKPRCAVLSPLFVGKYNYNTDNVVDNYIRQNYQLVWSDANFTLYKMP